jgi:hypothetical protein
VDESAIMLGQILERRQHALAALAEFVPLFGIGRAATAANTVSGSAWWR